MKPIQITGILGALGVALGAFGAHALKADLEEAGLMDTWRTAVLYHLVHTATLLAISLAKADLRFEKAILYCWTGGILLFSGSLYGLCLTGWSFLGPITPFGGLLFISGWGLLIIGGKDQAAE